MSFSSTGELCSQPIIGKVRRIGRMFPEHVERSFLDPEYFQLGSRRKVRPIKNGLNASGLEASRCAGNIGVCFWQNAAGPLPVSHFHTRFRSSTDVQDNIVQNQPGSDLVLADCVWFWPNGSGPEASRCARVIRPSFWQDATGPLPVSPLSDSVPYSQRRPE